MNAMIRPRNPCLAALLLAAVASAASAQVPSIWREQQLEAMDKSDAIMQRAHDQKGLLAQYQVMRRAYAADGKPAFRAIFGQYLSWYQSFLGDYRDAELAFSIQQKPLADDNPSPLAQPGWHHLRALDYIPQLAKQYRVVFLNEAHNIALTRTLTVRLLKPLREEGFNVFAVETLYQPDMAAMKERGYPIAKSGFYTREPIYAEMVLTAGYGPIPKTGQFLGAQSMAEHFVKDSGINPLSVEQTILIPHLDGSMNHPDYDAIIGAVHPDRPIVFVDKDGKPWSLRPGYDVSVIFPEEHFVNGRPTWAGLWGARVPYTVNGTVCQDHWPCMVAAFYADEGEDAIPADRMVLDPVPLMTIDDIKITSGNYSIPTGQLYLRPDQRYRLVISSERGQRIGSQTITVKSSDKSLTSAPPDSPRAAICSVAAVGQAAIQPVPCRNR